MDAAEEREAARWRERVEAVRLGMVVAHDRQAFDAWRAEHPIAGQRSRGLTGAGLEQAVMALAVSRPEYVTLATRAA